MRAWAAVAALIVGLLASAGMALASVGVDIARQATVIESVVSRIARVINAAESSLSRSEHAERIFIFDPPKDVDAQSTCGDIVDLIGSEGSGLAVRPFWQKYAVERDPRANLTRKSLISAVSVAGDRWQRVTQWKNGDIGVNDDGLRSPLIVDRYADADLFSRLRRRRIYEISCNVHKCSFAGDERPSLNSANDRENERQYGDVAGKTGYGIGFLPKPIQIPPLSWWWRPLGLLLSGLCFVLLCATLSHASPRVRMIGFIALVAGPIFFALALSLGAP